MSRRLGAMGVVMVLLFVALIGQSAYLSYFRANALDASSLNPRNSSLVQVGPRGDIYAANGEILAHSVSSGVALYPWKRVYPHGTLTSGLVGYSSIYYGNWGLENEYDSYLLSHKQPPQNWEQVLSPTVASDSITLTLEPVLQRVAQVALAGRDGAVVAINPRNGAILAMYSNPTFNPALITSPVAADELKARLAYIKPNGHGFEPLALLATQATFPPGSTFKVVTTAGVLVHKPALVNKSYPNLACTKLPTTNKVLCNDGGFPCGGTIAIMLPASCDPGYGLVGLDLGGSDLSATANSFGYNSTPPIDLPYVANSYFPSAGTFTFDQPQLAYSAIGQENVRATALQNALVAAGIANHGIIMKPHLLQSITGPEGQTVLTYQPSRWLTPLKASQASQIVPLMENVVRNGTAYGVGFLPQDDVAAKTGTAQTGNGAHNTDDWMIAFAPAKNPVVAIAVVVPYQAVTAYGATIAGPIVKCMVEATIAMEHGLPATNTPTTCHQ